MPILMTASKLHTTSSNLTTSTRIRPWHTANQTSADEMRLEHLSQQRVLCIGAAVLCLTAASLFSSNAFLDVKLFLPDDGSAYMYTTEALSNSSDIVSQTTIPAVVVQERSDIFPFLREFPSATTTDKTAASFDFSQLGWAPPNVGGTSAIMHPKLKISATY